DWYPTEKVERAYTLIHPDGTRVRLGLPERKNSRPVVTATELPLAGVYRMLATLPPQARAEEAVGESAQDTRVGAPIAVAPDLREIEDLTSLTDEEIDER